MDVKPEPMYESYFSAESPFLPLESTETTRFEWPARVSLNESFVADFKTKMSANKTLVELSLAQLSLGDSAHLLRQLFQCLHGHPQLIRLELGALITSKKDIEGAGLKALLGNSKIRSLQTCTLWSPNKKTKRAKWARRALFFAIEGTCVQHLEILVGPEWDADAQQFKPATLQPATKDFLSTCYYQQCMAAYRNGYRMMAELCKQVQCGGIRELDLRWMVNYTDIRNELAYPIFENLYTALSRGNHIERILVEPCFEASTSMYELQIYNAAFKLKNLIQVSTRQFRHLCFFRTAKGLDEELLKELGESRPVESDSPRQLVEETNELDAAVDETGLDDEYIMVVAQATC